MTELSIAATVEPPVLAVDAVRKGYGQRWALNGISFRLAAGERLAIVGPNGAGKTTLLEILAGVVEPTSGSTSTPSREVGWVPQHPALYSKLSVRQNLRLFARLERIDDVDDAVDRMLRRIGLADRAGDAVGRLSGGSRQRVNLAIGLLRDPAVLLLDEPSSSLDLRQRELLWDLVTGLADRGTTVVYSTHDLSEADRHADRLLVLADGEALFLGTAAALRSQAGDCRPLEAAFVDLVRGRGH